MNAWTINKTITTLNTSSQVHQSLTHSDVSSVYSRSVIFMRLSLFTWVDSNPPVLTNPLPKIFSYLRIPRAVYWFWSRKAWNSLPVPSSAIFLSSLVKQWMLLFSVKQWMKEEPWEPVRSKVHSIVRSNVSGQRFFGALFCVALCCSLLFASNILALFILTNSPIRSQKLLFIF